MYLCTCCFVLVTNVLSDFFCQLFSKETSVSLLMLVLRHTIRVDLYSLSLIIIVQLTSTVGNLNLGR